MTIPKTALLKLYTCYIRSVLEYGSVIYDRSMSTDHCKLTTDQVVTTSATLQTHLFLN